MTIPFSELRKKWRKDPSFMKEYDALAEEFELAKELIQASIESGLSQHRVSRADGNKPTSCCQAVKWS
jgi:hypothetical protein